METLLIKKLQLLGKTQDEIAKDLNISQAYVSQIMSGKILKQRALKKITDFYGFDYYAILKDMEDVEARINTTSEFISSIELDNIVEKENSSINDAMKSLNAITKRRSNGNHNINEGKLLTNEDMVLVKVTKIDIGGQAGLQAAFFSDEYVDKNFPTELQQVPQEEAGNHYYEIRVRKDGFSMIHKLEPLDWTRSVEIPISQWNDENIFKKNKIYCLWHPIRGILFKNIINRSENIITLHSTNPDKDSYPDEKFHLGEFKKILLVKKIIKDA
ncbi:helix-turn-helix domain-containing protein [Elizabethkingia miricola]|uniref:helix-turn-helix domain-containing protein n=1 Tax=Elizabethkingia miricola TaxID=172045 RepID=UPI003891C8A8